jgi:ubiquinone/menaquinone biosynthesis C-methylase UbiE
MNPSYNNQINLTGATDLYDELPFWSAPFGLKLLDRIIYKQHVTALDIGFGTGFPVTELAMRLGNTSVVYGIDPWKEAITRVKRKMEHYSISNIRLIEGEAENIPLETASVDLIASNNGINNVRDVNRVFAECSRIIKQGGQFIQTMNLDKSMFEFYTQFEKVLSDMKMQKEITLMKKHICEKRKPLDETMDLLQKHGFEIRNLDHHQFNYQFADGSAMFNHYFIRLAFMDSWIKLLPPALVDSVFSKIEDLLNNQAALLGSIKLSIPFVVIDAVRK